MATGDEFSWTRQGKSSSPKHEIQAIFLSSPHYILLLFSQSYDIIFQSPRFASLLFYQYLFIPYRSHSDHSQDLVYSFHFYPTTFADYFNTPLTAVVDIQPWYPLLPQLPRLQTRARHYNLQWSSVAMDSLQELREQRVLQSWKWLQGPGGIGLCWVIHCSVP